MSALLSIQEVADLEGVSYKAVNMRIQRSSIEAVKIPISGRQGFQYGIAIDQLTDKAKRRYYKSIAESSGAGVIPAVEESASKYDGLNITTLTAAQREDITFWKMTIEGWRTFIAKHPGEKTEMTAAFVESFNATHPRKITERTLRRKWQG